jgi:hypothetical protein
MGKRPVASARIKDVLESGKELINLYWNMLPVPLKGYGELKTHELGVLFLEAEKEHLCSY